MSSRARPVGLPPDGVCPLPKAVSTVWRSLIQELADLVAEAEGAPRRTVPPPAFETGLGDQLAVMVSDLMAVDPCPRRCEAAISAIRRTHAGLFRT